MCYRYKKWKAIVASLAMLGLMAPIFTWPEQVRAQAAWPGDCSVPLTAAQADAVVWLLHTEPDDDPVAVACTEALSEADGAHVFERLAQLEGISLDAATVGELLAQVQPGSVPEAVLAELRGRVALAGIVASNGQVPLRPIPEDYWKQHIEKGTDSCPSDYECVQPTKCYQSGDCGGDHDYVCEFNFPSKVKDPDSVKIYAKGSGRVNVLIDWTTQRYGGFSGWGRLSSTRVTVCVGGSAVSLAGGIDNVKKSLWLKHRPKR